MEKRQSDMICTHSDIIERLAEQFTFRHMMEMTVTPLESCEKYVDTGDQNFLGDIDITSAPKRTEAVLAAEDLEGRIILDGR